MSELTRIWYTTAEVAEMLGYASSRSVTDLIHAGTIRARRVGAGGSHWRIPRAELLRLAEAPEAS